MGLPVWVEPILAAPDIPIEKGLRDILLLEGPGVLRPPVKNRESVHPLIVRFSGQWETRVGTWTAACRRSGSGRSYGGSSLHSRSAAQGGIASARARFPPLSPPALLCLSLSTAEPALLVPQL